MYYYAGIIEACHGFFETNITQYSTVKDYRKNLQKKDPEVIKRFPLYFFYSLKTENSQFPY